MFILAGIGASGFSQKAISKKPQLEEYDMVIIIPNKFSSQIQPLIAHKNSNNVKTYYKTTEYIYDNYQGRDNPEKIKYFIKHELETYNITYVLLIGG